MLYELAQSLTSGLLIGGALAVLSVGFSMAWGITHVLNVAHCAFAVLAAYLGYWALNRWGIDPLLALPVMLPTFFLLGVAMHTLLIRATARRAHDPRSGNNGADLRTGHCDRERYAPRLDA
jgi:branched-chain amino acid transport system permease protein